MEELFIYGTLTNPLVQKQVLGYCLNMVPDILPGYAKVRTQIQNIKYPNISPAECQYVKGFVCMVSEAELHILDAYETSAYQRKKVPLKSGRTAWVYFRLKGRHFKG